MPTFDKQFTTPIGVAPYGLRMSITGLDRLYEVVDKLAKDVAPNAIGNAMFKEAEAIMEASQELVPVEVTPGYPPGGTLKGSGTVLPPEHSDTTTRVRFGYGGPASDYARIQHEDLTFHHDVGQAKYLEQPAREALAGLDQRLAQRVRDFVGDQTL